MPRHFTGRDHFRSFLDFQRLKVNTLTSIRHDEVRIERAFYISSCNSSVTWDNFSFCHAAARDAHLILTGWRCIFEVMRILLVPDWCEHWEQQFDSHGTSVILLLLLILLRSKKEWYRISWPSATLGRTSVKQTEGRGLGCCYHFWE